MDKIFFALRQRKYSLRSVAELEGVSVRTLCDWKKGKYTIPGENLESLVKLAGVQMGQLDTEQMAQWWSNSRAGRIGGRNYVEKYGMIGTIESRISGGVASFQRRRLHDNDIYTKKAITIPHDCDDFAEFIGIMIGDGSIGQYQISVTLDSRTDVEYAEYVMQLIERLFGIMPHRRVRDDRHCIVIEVSSVNLVEYLVSRGLPQGNKIRHGLSIPEWIKQNPSYSISCIRGIFDTDGSVFRERHHIKEKTYSYCRMSFVGASPSLLHDVCTILLGLQLTAKIHGGRVVTIGRFTDIEKYFRIIGSSNPKHRRRFVAYGGVG